jgi:phage terminase small subunit
MKDKEMQKHQKLNIREKLFIKNLACGMSQAEAAIKAGYSKKYADSFASRKVRESKVALAFAEILDKHGVTDDRIASVISEGLEAMKVISCNVIAEESKEDANSMTKDFIDVPDWLARHKFVDSTLKVKGYLKEKLDVNLKGDINIKIKGRD